MKKKVPDSDGYFISDTGLLYSVKRKVHIHVRKGYCRTNLYRKDGSRRCAVHIHRLVAEAFVPGKRPGLVVNHKDGNKQNNRASNLEWVPQAANIQHAYDTGLMDIRNRSGVLNPRHSLKSIQVHLICRMLKANVPINTIARKFGVTKGAIRPIKNKVTWVSISRKHLKD